MVDSDHTQQYKDLLLQSQRIMVITPENPITDIVAAMVALRNGLKRRNKKVRMIAPMIDETLFKWIPYLDEVEKILPARRSIVKINLRESALRQVSYELKGEDFYLYLTPRRNMISKDDVSVSLETLEVDLLITIGISDPSQLVGWPSTWPEELRESTGILNIDISNQNTQFGTANLVNQEKKSITQLIGELFDELSWEIDQETATLFLQGVLQRTRHFTVKVDSEVFKWAGRLMELGAVMEKNEALPK